MRPKRELDAYTLRHAAERLTELEAMADALVGVASLTKKPRKAK